MKKLLISCFLVTCCFSLKSQSGAIDPPNALWWINLGAGLADVSTDDEGYGTFLASFTKPVTTSVLLTGRGLFAQEAVFFVFRDPKEFWEGSLLAGLYSKGKVGFASIGAGLSVTGGRKDNANTPGQENFVTVGLPVESQLFLTLPFAGIGVVGFANINFEGAYWGAAVALQFGNLR